MTKEKAEKIANEIRAVLKSNDAHMYIDGNGAYGDAYFVDGGFENGINDKLNSLNNVKKGDHDDEFLVTGYLG